MRIAAAVTGVAAIITIFGFLTGVVTLPALWRSEGENSSSTGPLPPEEQSLPSQVEKGSTTLELGEGFSFSLAVVTEGDAGDLAFYWSSDGPGLRVPDGKIKSLGPVRFDSVSEVPNLSFWNSPSVLRVQVGHVYSLKISGGYYAKVLVTGARRKGFDAGTLSFDYAFQRTGTREFPDG